MKWRIPPAVVPALRLAAPLLARLAVASLGALFVALGLDAGLIATECSKSLSSNAHLLTAGALVSSVLIR